MSFLPSLYFLFIFFYITCTPFLVAGATAARTPIRDGMLISALAILSSFLYKIDEIKII